MSENFPSRKTFSSAANYEAGESFEVAENKTATKLAEIKIDVYQIKGEEDKKYSMTTYWNPHAWDNAIDIPPILTKVIRDVENAKNFWSRNPDSA